MLRACSIATSMSTARCCSAWKLPIATPNCLRIFRYSTVISCSALHHADGFGAQRGGGAHRRHARCWQRGAGGPEHGIGADAHALEGGCRRRARGPACGSRGASRRSALGVDEEQRHAVAIARVAVRAGRDDQQVGAVAGEHEALLRRRAPSRRRRARARVRRRRPGRSATALRHARTPASARRRRSRARARARCAGEPASRSRPPASTTVAR